MKGKRATVLLRMATIVGATVGTLFGAGCGGPTPEAGMPPGALTSTAKYEKDAKETPKADAGVKIPHDSSVDERKLKALVPTHGFLARSDPFALLAVEKTFDASQNAERILQMQTYITDWVPPVQPEPEVAEPQPYRRLAGVMVGDSVSAIIDMGDGKPPEIVYPGEKIAGTDWTVVSIDEEKAVLRRSGNKKPKEVVVPLAASLNGIIVQPGGGRTTPGGGNRPPGGPGGPRGGPGGPGLGGPGGGGAGPG